MIHCLIVDDTVLGRSLMSARLLDLLPDSEVTLANNGDEALEVITGQSTPSEFAFLDYNMPGMNGLELASRLLELLPDLKIALVTANIQKPLKDRAESLGIPVLHKPLDEDVFREHLLSIGALVEIV